jgi:ABC-2 type transport system permease protein
MNKLWLIVEREYLTRVRKKSFILTTLLSPLIFVALFTVPTLIALYTEKEKKSIAVKDESGTFVAPADTAASIAFTSLAEPLDVLKLTYRGRGFDGVLHIPAFEDSVKKLDVQYFSEGQLSLGDVEYIADAVEDGVEIHKVKLAGYSQEVMENFKTGIVVAQRELAFNEQGELVETDKKNNAAVASVIGFVSAFIIYVILLFYGTMIMRSVMEEKTSRIVEVMISSVRPFQLMLGKIIGVSGVGITQMLIWVGLTLALTSAAGVFFGLEAGTMGAVQEAGQQQEALSRSEEIFSMVTTQNWAYIIPVFALYFLGGYFIYASLFAAVGSAMGDDMGESQSLSMVAMTPIILSIIMLGPVIDDPTGSLATWLSLIPIFSPVIMPARLAFEPPVWELALSLALLLGSAVFFVWLSGRIYRVGILLYGKNAGLKEIVRWVFTRD